MCAHQVGTLMSDVKERTHTHTYLNGNDKICLQLLLRDAEIVALLVVQWMAETVTTEYPKED